MSNLDIAKNIPQDGRIRTRMAGREIDIRVSTLPVRHGERVVMLLRKSEFSLEGVGMSADTLEELKLINRPYGLFWSVDRPVLGKQPLYSALSEINSPDKNILNIEDPIEYELPGLAKPKSTPRSISLLAA